MKFTQAEFQIIAAGLRVAAVQYATDASMFSGSNPAHVRLREQFTRQSEEANRLAERIDNES